LQKFYYIYAANIFCCMKLYIRNMACESCKVVVKEALQELGYQPIKVELGEAEVKEKIPEKKQQELSGKIKKAGLLLVKSKEGVLADQIKALIAEYIDTGSNSKVNLSDYLSKKLHYDYAYLSNYFSAMQASTIEQYSISLKIEKVKELLVLEDLTLTQIADRLHYSSVAHLSSQFKKVNGLPASHFKKLKGIRRKTMQDL
jgi:YesN/AraC family two-component response regulator